MSHRARSGDIGMEWPLCYPRSANRHHPRQRKQRQIGDVTAGVCNGLTENRLNVFVDYGLDRVKIIKIHKCRGPTKAFDCLAKLRDGAAI